MQVASSEQLDSESANSVAQLRSLEAERLFHSLRIGQQRLAQWQGGELAVSAVPGAGKSTGMAIASALTIAREQLHSRKQLVIVTFTRSAAANIKAKIRQCLRGLYLPPTGFVVNTLHGLALNIASRHPDKSGLNLDGLTVISPNQNHRLIRNCVEHWIANHPRLYYALLEGTEFDGEETERIRRQSVLRTEVLPEIVKTVIHEAKSSGLLPQDLWELSQQAGGNYQILAIAAGLYEQYQQLLQQRDLIDYDEMILAALRVLDNDSARRLWQEQVFAVFEDEAQDSTPLQTKLLEILATDANNSQLNLVRVGDPNQAINSTFTPADPIYFRKFCQSCDDRDRLATMAQAGRSSQIVIDAANFVLDWVSKSKVAGNEEPFSYQLIRPVNPGDPQPDANPQPTGKGLEIHTPRDVYHSVELIGNRIVELFRENPEANAAVLVRENRQGTFVAQQLSYLRSLKPKIEVYDVAQSDRYSLVPGEVLSLLQFASRPHSPNYLKAALEALVQRKLIPTQDLNALSTLPEKFLYPGPLDPQPSATVLAARNVCRRLLDARLQLPSYQLIPFIAAEILKYDKNELATADKLAERISQQTHGNNTLGNAIAALTEIVTAESFDAVETEEPETRYLRPRQLTIITMHKAKGLDWDYVFIPFLHEDNIPGSPWVPNAAKFLGDFTLSEVARAQIRTSLHGDKVLPEAELAWQQATNLKTAEEFRLLYVAMTRAKRLLWLSAAAKGPFRWSAFNWERGGKLQEKKPCPVIPALQKRFPKSVIYRYLK
ncbi:ATP-dependent helicase [Merismopedia glauca]|uniref:DNA 3'-5' helicase n=1 Tax=Merismopedia glauca CCAP 1448/3 TaxID=1296344 RepID=A0A2T1C907_9CYAN|nr:ATP-dependent helicase [Merismopedia glauca]PSB04724.1 DNA helicase UvrD [Merismopedia glauca CCAP 1448/3]